VGSFLVVSTTTQRLAFLGILSSLGSRSVYAVHLQQQCKGRLLHWLLIDDNDSSVVKKLVVNWTEGVPFPAGVHREADHSFCVEMNMYTKIKGLDRKRLKAKYTNRRAEKGNNNSQEEKPVPQ
jgi:hypothetical protein